MTNNNQEETQEGVPNLLKSRIDLRALTLGCFANGIELLRSGEIEGFSLGENTQTIFFTNFDTVTGTILPGKFEKCSDKTKSIFGLHEVFMKTRNNYLNEYESEGAERVVNDSGHVALTDVEIRYHNDPNNPHKLAYFLLFPDQVVGLSFGEYQQNE